MKLWIVGKTLGGQSWEFAGVFSSEELAVKACVTREMFVGPATLDANWPVETCEWVGAYYPNVVNEESSGSEVSDGL